MYSTTNVHPIGWTFCSLQSFAKDFRVVIELPFELSPFFLLNFLLVYDMIALSF